MARTTVDLKLLRQSYAIHRLATAHVVGCGAVAMALFVTVCVLLLPISALGEFADVAKPGSAFFAGFVFLMCLDEYRLWVESNSPLQAAVVTHGSRVQTLNKELVR